MDAGEKNIERVDLPVPDFTLLIRFGSRPAWFALLFFPENLKKYVPYEGK